MLSEGPWSTWVCPGEEGHGETTGGLGRRGHAVEGGRDRLVKGEGWAEGEGEGEGEGWREGRGEGEG